MRPSMTITPDSNQIAVRIGSLIEQLDTLGDARAAAVARDLVRDVLTLHGSGFGRMLDLIRTELGGPPALLDRIAADPLLVGLLVLHDLHPEPALVRIDRALTALRPHLPAAVDLTPVA